MIIRFFTLAGMLAAVASGCNSNSTGPGYNPIIPSDWVSAVTNPYFPLVVGTTFEYNIQTPDGLETNTVEVLPNPRLVHGVAATEVHDQLFVDGALTEDTYDWYAQDGDGNVWYLGEDTKELENGQVVSTEGSWEWGVDGALLGIIMWADPAAHFGEEYRQEYLKDVAEDFGKVVALDETVEVPFGTINGCVKTEDRSGLSSGLESKYYCPQIGTALEVDPGAGERVELVSVTGP